MPLLVGMGLSAGIAFLTFFFGKTHLSQEQTVLVQRPLPAMDVLETAGIKKFPLSYLEDLRFCSLYQISSWYQDCNYLSPLSNCTVPSALVILPSHI